MTQVIPQCGLHVEHELHDITVLDDVVLTLHAELACLAGARLATKGNKVVEADGLGLDEAALEVGMYDPCRLGCLRANAHRPGTHLLGTSSKVTLQPQQVVCRLRQGLKSTPLKSKGLEVLCRLSSVGKS